MECGRHRRVQSARTLSYELPLKFMQGTGTHLLEVIRLLEECDLVPGAAERDSSGKARDTATDDNTFNGEEFGRTL